MNLHLALQADLHQRDLFADARRRSVVLPTRPRRAWTVFIRLRR